MENILSVPIIAGVVYIIVNVIKKLTSGSEKFKRLIPVISAVVGAVLGCVAFFVVPSIILADSVWSAVIIGIASGLSATGTNQIQKQLSKYFGKDDNNGSE